MVQMIEIMKTVASNRAADWRSESARDGHCVKNITKEFEDLFARLIVIISFGDDVTDSKMPIYVADKNGRVNLEECTLA